MKKDKQNKTKHFITSLAFVNAFVVNVGPLSPVKMSSAAIIELLSEYVLKLNKIDTS